MNSRLLLFLILLVACRSAKHSSTVCGNTFTVVNKNDLDGCGFLLKDSKGNLYKPIESIQPNFQFKEGQLLDVRYQELKGLMSTCLAEKGSIKITCLNVIQQPCPSFKSASDLSWLVDLCKKVKPNRLTYYEDPSDRYYFQLRTNANYFLYDCEGNMTCSYPVADTTNDCNKKIKTFEKPVNLVIPK